MCYVNVTQRKWNVLIRDVAQAAEDVSVLICSVMGATTAVMMDPMKTQIFAVMFLCAYHVIHLRCSRLFLLFYL